MYPQTILNVHYYGPKQSQGKTFDPAQKLHEICDKKYKVVKSLVTMVKSHAKPQ